MKSTTGADPTGRRYDRGRIELSGDDKSGIGEGAHILSDRLIRALRRSDMDHSSASKWLCWTKSIDRRYLLLTLSKICY
jgi:hypothetical protein